MRNLHQGKDGYIRMNQHFADGTQIRVSFHNGQVGVFTSRKLNRIFDTQLAEYRKNSWVDQLGVVRGPTNRRRPKNNIMFVYVESSWAKRDYSLAA